MSTFPGRPRKACSTCKSHKIRCTRERPVCTRCQRLNHTCIYSTPPNTRNARRLQPGSNASKPSSTPTHTGAAATGDETSLLPHHITPVEDRYLGIPKPLLLTLVEVYYDNVYNARLLLHKRQFLESLAAGTARPHIVLSVCAWAANFYRDQQGQATLMEHGFMIDWAQQASRLAFQDTDDLVQEDHIVTFCNLALFWHSQGSWRLCHFYKGNAYNLLQIIGLGPKTLREGDSLTSELRRRHFWACYLMQCHSSECLAMFETIADVQTLALPCPEKDFEAGVLRSPRMTLKSGSHQGLEGVYAEVIKVLTIWVSILAHFRAKSSLHEGIPAIHVLDEKLSIWWQELRPEFRLTPSSIATSPPDVLPRVLLVNIVYHQSLCALHASIVPLFSWGAGDGWLSARQLSAQVAFEHACAASELIHAVLSTFDRLTAMPSFIAYAAYSGCAIQIPFMWSSNPAVKDRARANVRANVKMLHILGAYWKFAALLEIYVRHLFDAHKRNPVDLEHEPRFLDPNKLTRAKVNAPNAQVSILEFNGMLRSRENGITQPGKEGDLGIEHEPAESEAGTEVSTSYGDQGTNPTQVAPECLQYRPSRSIPVPSTKEQQQLELQLVQQQQVQARSAGLASHQPDVLRMNHQNLDVFQTLIDPEMLKLYPNGELPDLSQFDTSPLSLEYFDIDDWSRPTVAPNIRTGCTAAWDFRPADWQNAE